MLEEFSVENPNNIRRRLLLPTWIKIFIWFFMITGSLVIPLFILALFGFNFQLELYGFTADRPISFIGISLVTIFLFKGIVSYSLWFEEDWAISLGLIDSTMGILICIISMFGIPFLSDNRTSFSFRGEIVLLIPYLLKLNNLKAKWRMSYKFQR